MTTPELLRKALDNPVLCADLYAGVEEALVNNSITLDEPDGAAKLQTFFDTALESYKGQTVKDFILSLSDYTAVPTRGAAYTRPEVWIV